MKISIIGSGAREDALAWAIKKSATNHITILPGNGGTFLRGNREKITDFDDQIRYLLDTKPDMVVIGPEVPLVLGMSDILRNAGIPVFGPQKTASNLEGSKTFSKEILNAAGVKTAEYKYFTTAKEAIKYFKTKPLPSVIKADGLAAGKGVLVAKNYQSGIEFIEQILIDNKFNSNSLIIEDFISGEEVSILCLVDKDTIIPLESARDYKPAYNNNKGPNTGGMGSFSPSNIVDEEFTDLVVKTIFQPVINELHKRGIEYNGLLYGGLIKSDDTISVLEFNCRFGDPETQSIVRRLNTDIVELFDKTIRNKLHQLKIEWSDDPSLSVVLASKGYPGDYQKGSIINNVIHTNNMNDIEIFFAGVKYKENNFYSNGGRVLTVTGTGKTLSDCRQKVYAAVENIESDNLFYRDDIGNVQIQN